jgi:hypothetical protein
MNTVRDIEQGTPQSKQPTAAPAPTGRVQSIPEDMADNNGKPALSTMNRVEPQSSTHAQEYLRKIVTVPVDLEAAVNAVLRMYEVTVIDK